MALSIAATTPAPHFNTAPPSLNGSAPQPAAGPGIGDATASAQPNQPRVQATNAGTASDAVKPTPQLAGNNRLAPGGSASFATNPASTGAPASSAADYATAIAAYTRQSVVGFAPSSAGIAAGGVAPGAAGAVQAANSNVSQASVPPQQFNVRHAAGSNPQTVAQNTTGGVAPTDNTAAQAPNAAPPNALEAGGQANPIAAPTSHAVMSLLKMI